MRFALQFKTTHDAPKSRVMNTHRNRPIIQITLSPEAIARLGEMTLRTGESRSAMIERLVHEAKMPRAHAPAEGHAR